MAYMGANVLHEAAVFPVQEADIPIQIKIPMILSLKGQKYQITK